MVNVGPLEIVLVAIIALIVLGPQRLPDVARSVGRGMREFRSALSGAANDDDEDVLEPGDDEEEEDDELPPPPSEPPGADGDEDDLPEGR
ncbi:MAG: twin-arginine translocase TatA/TatE family subunit [Actinomycetota bacterium]|nr:twin-arginine translocase TatA/TatE family subunit [Actinomycetota bacterium]